MKKNPESAFLKHLAVVAQKNDAINPELYEKYDVKRGLRYSNGTGVLVGLTKIGDVVGYELKDGKKVPIPGKLLYRGYDIAELVHDSEKHNDFGYEQSVYLLMFGKLPTKKQLVDFKKYLGSLRVLPPNFTEDMIMKAPSNDIMNKIARGVLASYSYDPDPENRSVDNIMRQCLELIARFSTLAAYAYQAKRRYYDGQSMYIHNPNTELSTAENFLHLIRFDGKYTKLEAQILDLALILHAEHGGGNNSSLTVHVVSSADTDTYSSIAAAVGSLKGRRHGGANIRVMEMMDDLKAHVKDWTSDKQIRDYLTLVATRKAFDKTGLIYGMGHAIYTVSDPRAVLLNELAEKLAKQKGCLDEFNLYKRIEKIAPEVIYSIHGTGKRICANVDFFSGFVYTMLGIPRELFTPLFAISRIAGWSAHRIEEVSAGGRIYRPAYKNICPVYKYVKIDDR
ncbi:citrate/2-methylcitrate synthase [Treponema sp.]|uniref:citrate/2-methylcitrate synthase n=1 Tax=Treponema sp. TaxID=166 RepID=UPI00388F6907